SEATLLRSKSQLVDVGFDGCVTVRDRDTMEQERIKIDELVAYIEKKIAF
ncbi:His/Gly/Thr/Pro-type tRNA ligase C-terminal domain-containing protein, partial [Ruminococcus bicirculans (ex Wegman et al. 2014)]